MRSEQVVEAVSALEECRTRGEDDRRKRCECRKQAGELASGSERARAASDEGLDSAVLPPQAEGHGEDESARRGDVAAVDSCALRPLQSNNRQAPILCLRLRPIS